MKKIRKTAKKKIRKWYDHDLKPALTNMRKTLADDARILAKVVLFPLEEMRASEKMRLRRRRGSWRGGSR